MTSATLTETGMISTAASSTEVEIFRLEEQQVLISSGILPGERICISPIQAVVDGMAVQPVIQAI